MNKPASYKDLIVWQKSIFVVELIYALTSRLPGEEKFGLTSQMRRAAVSIPSNIAEGQARRTTPDFVRFLSNAEGSLAELETQLIISVELRFLREEDLAEVSSVMDEIRRMLNSLRRKLVSKSQNL